MFKLPMAFFASATLVDAISLRSYFSEKEPEVKEVLSTPPEASETETVPKTAPICKALALSGGASKGAFQAGAIYGLINGVDHPEDFEWDVLTGVSTGAINASMIGVWPKGATRGLADYIVEKWSNLKTSDIYGEWPDRAFFHLSKYNINNLADFLRRTLDEFYSEDKGYQRKTSVGVVQLPTMKYIPVRLDRLDGDRVKQIAPLVAVASSAMPVYFQPQKIKNNFYVDGGVRHKVDLETAIQNCRETVDSDSQITLDVILLDDNGIDVLSKDKGAAMQSSGMHEVVEAMQNHPEVNFRYLLAPSVQQLKGYNFIDFDASNTTPLIEAGKLDAKKALSEGPGFRFEQLRNMCLS